VVLGVVFGRRFDEVECARLDTLAIEHHEFVTVDGVPPFESNGDTSIPKLIQNRSPAMGCLAIGSAQGFDNLPGGEVRSPFQHWRQKNRKLPEFHYTLWYNDAMDALSNVLTAISHPTRRAMIRRLTKGPARFLDVAQPFNTALNSVTKHLKILERAGLIERRRKGREVFISFRGEPLQEVAGWVHEIEYFWNTHLDEFEKHFKDEEENS